MTVVIFADNCVFCFHFLMSVGSPTYRLAWYTLTHGVTHNPILHSWHLHFVLFSLFLVQHTQHWILLPCTSQCLLCLESSFFKLASVNGHEVMFYCWPVTFQHVPLIMPHLHNNCQKQTHDLNCHARHWGPSFIHHVQVLVIISTCLFHQLLYDCKIEQHENAQWPRVFVDMECLCLS